MNINDNNINIIKEQGKCYGCELCQSVCPVNAISFSFDNGFLNPMVDNTKCIECGKCLKECISNNPVENKEYELNEYYYGFSSDEKRIISSSSGGAATELARLVIEKYKGTVYGVEYDERTLLPKYRCVKCVNDLKMVQGTKYAQARKGEIFKKIKADLEAERVVLFVGTPCEVAAVKRYCGKNTNRLICAQLICMGVTSPVVFKKFITEKCSIGISSIKERYKKNKNWVPSYVYIKSEQKDYCRPFDLSEYSFLFKWIGRSTCYKCHYKGTKRVADITIGDFWGASQYIDTVNPKGMSIVSVHTEKGKELVGRLNWNHLENYNVEMHNRFINNCRPEKIDRDDIIYDCMSELSCKAIVKKHVSGKEKIRFLMSQIVSNSLWDFFKRS